MKYDKKVVKGHVYFRHRLYDPVTQKTKDITAKTLKELKEKVRIAEEKTRYGIVEDKVTFGAYFNDWLDNVHLIDKKPATVERYKSCHRNHVKGYRIELIKLKDLKINDVQDHYNTIFEKKKSSKTVETMHRIIKPCIRYAYETQRILKDFSGVLKIPVDSTSLINKKSKVNPLSLEEQFDFIERTNNHKLHALFTTALDTGLRMGELFALNWDDVDFDKMEIRVTKTLSFIKDQEANKWKQDISTTKTVYSRRVIPLPLRTKGILLEHQVKQKKEMKRMGFDQDNETLVFCTPIGTGYERGNVLKRIKKVYADMGIPTKTFHDLRHTYATRLFEMGENPKTVQVLLGHANVSTTLSTYIHVLESLKVQAAAKIDGLYVKKKPIKKVRKKATDKMLWETSGKPLRLVR